MKNSFKKMSGSIMRVSDLFTDEQKKKLYDGCERKSARKAPIASLAEELIGNNATVLCGIATLQEQKDYIVAKVKELRNVTDAKRNKFLNGNYGCGGVLTATSFNDLLAVLTRAALNGNGLAMPYSRRK